MQLTPLSKCKIKHVAKYYKDDMTRLLTIRYYPLENVF